MPVAQRRDSLGPGLVALEEAHSDDPLLATAREQEGRMGRLLADGHVTGRLLHAVAR